MANVVYIMCIWPVDKLPGVVALPIYIYSIYRCRPVCIYYTILYEYNMYTVHYIHFTQDTPSICTQTHFTTIRTAHTHTAKVPTIYIVNYILYTE